MQEHYSPAELEAGAQAYWETQQAFKAVEDPGRRTPQRTANRPQRANAEVGLPGVIAHGKAVPLRPHRAATLQHSAGGIVPNGRQRHVLTSVRAADEWQDSAFRELRIAQQ